MSLFKKHRIKNKQNSEVPGYGSRWSSGRRDSSKGGWKKEKTAGKSPNGPVDTSFVYYEDK